MKKLIALAALGLGMGAFSLVVVACDNSSGAPHDNPPVDSGSGGNDTGTSGNDGGGVTDGAPAPDCFTNPKTHFEIINACTDAAKVDKKPALPLLQPDGSLPPLP